MMPGSVCRHLKIAGRGVISRLFHVTSQQPRKLQHIRIDAPASSALTQERLGWRPTAQPGLIADLDHMRYFEAA
jgi:hypothetical protein